MSLRWRILAAFVFVIVLAVSVTVAVGYYTAQRQLDAFVAELGRVEAAGLTRDLSRSYTSSDGWNGMNIALFEAGYLYDEGAEHGGLGEGEHGTEGGKEEGEAGSEFFHIDRIRIVVVDNDGTIVLDNFQTLEQGEPAPDLDGQRTVILDLRTNQPVGYAFIDVNREFLATESLGFLRELLYRTAIGGLLVLVVALLLAAWLANRITNPVTALTRATQSISEHGNTILLPVNSSDELGQMSTSFNQMTVALQTQRDLRKRLIDDVSHELNTPLSVIQLEAHGLRKGLQTSTVAADNIIQEVSMLRHLVRDLTWLAETDSGEQRIAVEPCSIPQLLGDEVARWQPQAQLQQINLSLQPLPELPALNLDKMRMSQALGNVIRNALQHTEAGGQITLGAALEESSYVSIFVEDDGLGIDTADLPHVFDRFYRTDQSRNRGTGGAGLGLAIARAIVEAHNGTIRVSSDGPNEGTTVHVDLPIPSTTTTS